MKILVASKNKGLFFPHTACLSQACWGSPHLITPIIICALKPMLTEQQLLGALLTGGSEGKSSMLTHTPAPKASAWK